ncbi:MAG: putative colanic acid biosynthesis acetyltransferase [Bacteroidales bacterium]|nr:putative colanic acid biosynthesis acetyltransferase [Bacteroidales bacterium]
MLENQKIDLSQYENALSRKNQIARFIWNITWFLFARPFPRSIGNKWRIFLLKIFGAKVSWKAVIYSNVRIYMPWKLKMNDYACLAPEVDCYNVDWVIIGANSTISQKSYLCTASHDIYKSNMPLITAPIVIEDQVWVAADVYIGPGITIHQGSVIAARAVVVKDVEPWTIVGGNPAKFIKKREIHE